jgi:hypothetical protein
MNLLLKLHFQLIDERVMRKKQTFVTSINHRSQL